MRVLSSAALRLSRNASSLPPRVEARFAPVAAARKGIVDHAVARHVDLLALGDAEWFARLLQYSGQVEAYRTVPLSLSGRAKRGCIRLCPG